MEGDAAVVEALTTTSSLLQIFRSRILHSTNRSFPFPTWSTTYRSGCSQLSHSI